MSEQRDMAINVLTATVVAPLVWLPVVAITLWLGWWSWPVWSAAGWLYLVWRAER